MCAVATAWPVARATSRAAATVASRAAACAETAALRASPTVASPRDHARAISTARCGRSSLGYAAENKGKTCSAQSAAQAASRRWVASSSSPPRRIATKRRSLEAPTPPSPALVIASPATPPSNDSKRPEPGHPPWRRGRSARSASLALTSARTASGTGPNSARRRLLSMARLWSIITSQAS